MSLLFRSGDDARDQLKHAVPRMSRARAHEPPKGTAMKANLFVCSLVAVSLPLSGASAARYAVHVRTEDRALTANPQMTPFGEPLFHGGSDCGVDRAVPVWGRNGEAVGYECLSGANGS
jgi:hypothetical protein